MYQITYQLPDSKIIEKQLLGMDEQQQELVEITEKIFRLSQ